MKIIRDGKEIELTRKEMRSAWEEIQLEYDRCDIENVCDIDELDLSDVEKNEATQIYRHIRDNSTDWWSYAQEVCENIIKERG